jgi:hypothetical protein
VGYSYPSGLEKNLCKWEVYVPLVTKGLNAALEGRRCPLSLASFVGLGFHSKLVPIRRSATCSRKDVVK